MNFARTNLSLLLARQTRQAAQRDAVATRRIALPQAVERLAAIRCPEAPMAATPHRFGQTLEIVGALAMMAAFMVLALFG